MARVARYEEKASGGLLIHTVYRLRTKRKTARGRRSATDGIKLAFMQLVPGSLSDAPCRPMLAVAWSRTAGTQLSLAECGSWLPDATLT